MNNPKIVTSVDHPTLTKEEFDAKLLRYQRLVRKIVWPYVRINEGKIGTEDDVFQDVMAHALTQRDHFDPTKNDFGTWLGSVARNYIFGLIRHANFVKKSSGKIIPYAYLQPKKADHDTEIEVDAYLNTANKKLPIRLKCPSRMKPRKSWLRYWKRQRQVTKNDLPPGKRFT